MLNIIVFMFYMSLKIYGHVKQYTRQPLGKLSDGKLLLRLLNLFLFYKIPE